MRAVVVTAAVTGAVTAAASPALAQQNTPPNVPTDLRLGDQQKECGATLSVPSWDSFLVSAAVTDPDGDSGLRGRAALWPVNDPTQRDEVATNVWSGRFTVGFASELLPDGQYAWQARGEDADGAVSDWSAPCEFTVDNTRPATPPAVTSTDYPENSGPPGHGAVGVAGDFTFTANDQDVVAFRYEGIGVPYGEVAASAGTATASIAPTFDGPVSLSVYGVDRAGNRSDSTTYHFWVRSTQPLVETGPAVVGQPVTATFTARQDGATTFHYGWENQESSSTPMGADGTATVTIDLPSGEPWYFILEVWTSNADGDRSPVNSKGVQIDPRRPTVELADATVTLGEPLTITFRPAMDDVASYTYWVEEGTRSVVPAAADGTATVTADPGVTGGFTVRAFSTTASGVDSGVGEDYGSVQAPAPTVTSAEYPEDAEGGAPGVAGTFHFASTLPDVVEFRYNFNDEDLTVPAGPDGTATVTYTPTWTGHNRVLVRAVVASGLETDLQIYRFAVSGAEPTVEGVPTEPVPAGDLVRLRFTATLPGTTEFVYTDGGVEHTVKARRGTARVTVTADDRWGTGSHSLSVYSRTADGLRSDPTYVSFPVTG
jgi:hypothetical protein